MASTGEVSEDYSVDGEQYRCDDRNVLAAKGGSNCGAVCDNRYYIHRSHFHGVFSFLGGSRGRVIGSC